MSTFTKYLFVILIGLILLLTFTYSTDYIKINLPLSFSSNPFSFNSEKQNNSSESQVIHETPINSSAGKDVIHHQPNPKLNSQLNPNLKPQLNPNLKPLTLGHSSLEEGTINSFRGCKPKGLDLSISKEPSDKLEGSRPINLKSQDDNKFFGLNMPKSSAFSLDYLSNKEEKQEKNFTFENFFNDKIDVEEQDKENIDNFLIDTNFTTNESDNIDNKLFIQTEDYQMTENTHNAITNALRNI
jgi:hypothetical protein